jgi:hypothetical protein
VGAYPAWKYKEYVEWYASVFEVDQLLHPDTIPLDEYPRFQILYISMPEWLAWTNQIPDPIADDQLRLSGDGKVGFRLWVREYKWEMNSYIDNVIAQIDQISGTLSGEALLEEFDDKTKFVTFVPYNWKMGEMRNADVVTASGYSQVASIAKGKPVSYDPQSWSFGDLKDPGSIKRHSLKGLIGLGNGTNATVEFAPGIWDDPDEVLYHELVHASRIVRGVLDRMPVDHNYDDAEEYLAVVLTNIYMSEKGQFSHLRADHADGLLSRRAASWFLQNPQHVNMPPAKLIEGFRNTQWDFYNKLAQLPPDRPKNNWVGEYERNRARYHPDLF